MDRDLYQRLLAAQKRLASRRSPAKVTQREAALEVFKLGLAEDERRK